MPYRIVKFVPQYPYHIYNRGSEKRVIFQSHRDYNKFLEHTKEYADKYAIRILCYCLMPNHFHFLLQQETDESSIVSFMNSLQLSHAKFFNTKYMRVGPLFQGRFKAKLVETDEYLLQLSAYIHRNPIAEFVDSRNLIQERLRTYPYSSYPEYLNNIPVSISKPETILHYFSQKNKTLRYESFVEQFIPDLDTLAPILASI